MSETYFLSGASYVTDPVTKWQFLLWWYVCNIFLSSGLLYAGALGVMKDWYRHSRSFYSPSSEKKTRRFYAVEHERNRINSKLINVTTQVIRNERFWPYWRFALHKVDGVARRVSHGDIPCVVKCLLTVKIFSSFFFFISLFFVFVSFSFLADFMMTLAFFFRFD